MQAYIATTENITVTVRPLYLDGQSNILGRKFVFAYFVRIQNDGDEPVQLMRRHWYVRTGEGNLKEVEGEGVIGQQPVIDPGEAHEYSSYSVLETFEGTMEGTYLMKRPDGELFTIVIPKFVLRAAAN
ncbi:MAG: Co2+/Mg2+ efflux protein ApaG [Bacteroidota bacterium]